MSNSAPVNSAESLAQLFDAFNRHDIDGVMAFFANDCQFFTVAGNQVHGTLVDGSDAIAKAFCGVWDAMPDAHWQHHGHFVHGDRAVSEWTFTGTNADGSRVEAQGADLFTLRGGKIVIKQAFRKNRPLITS